MRKRKVANKKIIDHTQDKEEKEENKKQKTNDNNNNSNKNNEKSDTFISHGLTTNNNNPNSINQDEEKNDTTNDNENGIIVTNDKDKDESLKLSNINTKKAEGIFNVEKSDSHVITHKKIDNDKVGIDSHEITKHIESEEQLKVKPTDLSMKVSIHQYTKIYTYVFILNY